MNIGIRAEGREEDGMEDEWICSREVEERLRIY